MRKMLMGLYSPSAAGASVGVPNGAGLGAACWLLGLMISG